MGICTDFKKEGAITFAKKSYSVVLLFFDVLSLCNYLLYMLLNIHDCSSWIVFFCYCFLVSFLIFLDMIFLFSMDREVSASFMIVLKLVTCFFFQHSMINND